MLSKLRKQTKGFTIIEVLIVLAIAGLILLIVLLAIPALQRNSRNTSRKNDVSAILGAITEYVNNNNGALPATQAEASTALSNAKLGFYKGATSASATALTTEIVLGDVSVQVANAAIGTGTPTTFPSASRVYVRFGAKCASSNDFTGTGASSRGIAVGYTIDTSGGTTSACQES